ncbi:MAG: FtsX-like permease family protein [Spirochaetia bacterium]|nr:FtsX-like permease family protein [Spirochaetia bacterium]
MFLKFAFRNLMRNKKRTFVSALSVFFAAALVGFAYGWINGVLGLYSDGFIKYQTANLRITTETFEAREKFMPVDEIIPNADELIKKIKDISGVSSVEKRVRFGILLGKDDVTVSAAGMGLDLENNSFDLKKKLIEGNITSHGIYLGYRLARQLRLKTGEEILLAAKTSEGGLNGIKLKVAGIFKMKMASFDKHFFFLNFADASRLLKIHKGSPEIYVFTENIENTENLQAQIKPLLSSGLVVRTFIEQMGGMYEMLKMMKFVYLIIEVAILALACFVIINTMIMAIFERMREIGTLKALGFTENNLFWIFTTEGALIGVFGGIPGAILGFVIIFIMTKTGVNLENMLSNVEMPIEYIVRPQLGITDILGILNLAILVPVLASMLPARYIKKYLPSEALRM